MSLEVTKMNCEITNENAGVAPASTYEASYLLTMEALGGPGDSPLNPPPEVRRPPVESERFTDDEF